MSTSTRYLVFVRERFPPGAYLPLIGVFVAAGYVPSVTWSGAAFQPLRFTAAIVVVGLAFLHLRLVDELKDADVDRLGRPSRPLPRGLVTERELTGFAAMALLAAISVAAALGLGPMLAMLPASLCILLADVEFFAPRRIHSDLVVYALAHSAVVPLLLVFAWFASAEAKPSVALPGLAVLAWGVGLGLEISRKTYAPHEERPFVETYSSALGRRRAGWLAAASLAIGMAGGSIYAGLAGAGATATLTGAALAGLILTGGVLSARVTHRAGEAIGSLVGLAILLWPVGVAIVLGGTGR